MNKITTKTIKIKNVKKNYNFGGITYTHLYGYEISTNVQNYTFDIERNKYINMLNNDLDKNIKNIRIVYEVEQEILDNEEREYLRNVIKPFRNRVENIKKMEYDYMDKEYIFIEIGEFEGFSLPLFEKNTMYRGMETDKKYTIEELGL